MRAILLFIRFNDQQSHKVRRCKNDILASFMNIIKAEHNYDLSSAPNSENVMS